MTDTNEQLPEKTGKKDEKTEYVVPPEGSLGLLALGAAGIRAWRKKRDEVKKEQKNKQADE